MKTRKFIVSLVLISCIAFSNIAFAGEYVLHLQTDQTVYQLGNVVTISGDIIYNGTSVDGLVAIQIDHNDTHTLFRTLFTGATPPPPIGDINGDGVVDILDIVIVASAYGSTPSSPNWNIIADINGDGAVDILDIVIVSGHYGQTGWGIVFGVRLLTVYLTDMSHNIVNQVKNGTSYLVYSQFKNTQTFPIHVLAAFTVYDANNVPIYAFSPASMDAQPGEVSTAVGQWDVPENATFGPATIYGSIFSDIPSLGGYPHSPEKSKAFTIASSLGLMSAEPSDLTLQQIPGTFETSFKIPNNTSWTGTYAIFGASIYNNGSDTRFYFNSTTIQVNP